MKHLEQIRAAAALHFWTHHPDANKGQEDGNVISGMGSLILRDGLLATLAFCHSKGKGHSKCAENVCEFLYSPERALGIPKAQFRPQMSKLENFIYSLAQADSQTLQLATQEAVAYLQYLKRLAP